jgi:ABC-type glycerol-3-phosphate transport system substrate-binding protein
MAHDGKKVLYFIKKVSAATQIIKEQNDILVATKAEWQAENPNVTIDPQFIDGNQVTAFNTFAASIKNACIDNVVVIDEFKAIADVHPSPNADSMNVWS